MSRACTFALSCVLAACSNPRDAYQCTGNAACLHLGVQGACEETGFCSFPDTACPSGTRYGTAAGNGLGNTCVDAGPDPLGSWAMVPKISPSRYSGATATIGNRVYMMGGIGGSTGYPDVTVGEFAGNAITGGGITWTPTTAMPSERRALAAATDGSWIYVIGGRTDVTSESASVIVAPVMSDGMVGAWQPTTALPAGLRCLETVTWNSYVYAVGGKGSGATIANVLVGTMSGGTIDSWRPAGSLGTMRGCLAAATSNGYIYAIAGCTDPMNGCKGTMLSDVQYAKINEDGTLGPFKPTTPLPEGRWHHTATANATHMIVIGGKTSAGESNAVYTTHINADGSLGTWRAGTPIGTAGGRRSASIIGDYVVVVSSSTYVAPFQ